MNNKGKINFRDPPKSTDFQIIFNYFWNHGVGNRFDKDGDPRPWTAESLEAACETAGKPVDRRTIQNWKSGKNKPGRRNMHVLAKVASAGVERQRQIWADVLIATLETKAPMQTKPQQALHTKEVSEPFKNITPETLAPVKSSRRHLMRWIGAAIAALFILNLGRSLLSTSTEVDPLRVAVMPLDNLSADPAYNFISAGMTDDIIQSLTQLPALYVTPRRDSRTLDRASLSVAEIGQALDVDHILDGTIRIDSGRMRLNAVLIETRTGEHIWSGKFDDRTDDIFSIQESVAEGVTNALDIYMSPEHRGRMFDFGTVNVEAYRQYLRGRHLMKFWHETHTGDDIWRAGEALEAAVAADPSMARAWVHMTDLYHHYAADHIDAPATPMNVTVPRNQTETIARLKDVLSRGEMSGDGTTSRQARANRIFFSDDWTDLRQSALEYANHVTPKRGELEWLYTPIMLVLLGETKAQERLMEDRVLKYDPGNATGHAYIVRQYLTSGQYDRARARLKSATSDSFSSRLAEVKGYLLLAEGNGTALATHIEENAAKLSPLLKDYFTAMSLHLQGQTNAADVILSESSPLARERIHLALAQHHMGRRKIASELFAEIAREPIGPLQISVQLSYGAACGPTPLPPIPPLEARMKAAKIAPLPCIGRANP